MNKEQLEKLVLSNASVKTTKQIEFETFIYEVNFSYMLNGKFVFAIQCINKNSIYWTNVYNSVNELISGMEKINPLTEWKQEN